ncbi:MAG: preprotein translocase subunit YajC [Propionibacteriaceae bacterium]
MGNSPYSTLVLIALMVVAFYFLIIRPNKKRQQAQQQTMNSLQPGTRVLLSSGVFGTIIEIGEKQAVLELSPGVHLTVLKQAIARAVKPGDEDTEFESEDESYDDLDEVDSAAPQPYGGDSVGTNPSSTPGSTPTVSSATDDNAPASAPTHTGEAPSPWSSEASTYPSSSDQDPRSGTNTTPIKD